MDPAGRDYKRPRTGEAYPYNPQQAAQYGYGWGPAPGYQHHPGYGPPQGGYAPPFYPPQAPPPHGPPAYHQPQPAVQPSATLAPAHGRPSPGLLIPPCMQAWSQGPYGQYTAAYAPHLQQGYPSRPHHENAAPRPPPGQLSGVKRNWEAGQSPHELNRRITASYSPVEILQLACEHSATFDAVNVATCLHRIAKHRPTNMQPVFSHPGYNCILSLVGTHIRKFQAQQLANIMWAFATIEAEPPRQLLQVRSLGIYLSC